MAPEDPPTREPARPATAERPPRGSGRHLRVALTHSEGRLEDLAPALEAAGVRVLHAPLIATTPREDDATRRAVHDLLACPWILVTSRSTVEAWTALGFPWTGPARLGAVGPKTAAALRAAGARVDVIGDPHDAAGLAAAFRAHDDARGPVGLPQGSRARPDLRDALEAAGYEVRPVTIYDTTPEPWPSDVPEPDAVVIASPSALDALPADVAARATLVALGPTTAEAIRDLGVEPRVADEPSPAGVLRALGLASPPPRPPARGDTHDGRPPARTPAHDPAPDDSANRATAPASPPPPATEEPA